MCLYLVFILLMVSSLFQTTAKVVKAQPKGESVHKTAEEKKAAFKARKALKIKAAALAIVKLYARTPEAKADRARARKEAADKVVSMHHKMSKAKKRNYEMIKANKALRKPKKYNGKNPKYAAKAKAKLVKHKSAVATDRKKLEELAGMKFIC